MGGAGPTQCPTPSRDISLDLLDHKGALPVHLPGEGEGGQAPAHQCIRLMAAHTSREEGRDRSDHSNAAQCKPLVSGTVDRRGMGQLHSVHVYHIICTGMCYLWPMYGVSSGEFLSLVSMVTNGLPPSCSESALPLIQGG